MRINASNTNVMSAIYASEHHQSVLLDGESLEDVDQFFEQLVYNKCFTLEAVIGRTLLVPFFQLGPTIALRLYVRISSLWKDFMNRVFTQHHYGKQAHSA